MKRHHILGLAFLAIFAFSAVLAASASAETTLLAEWLEDGNPITVPKQAETSGELLLEQLGLADVLCSATFFGTVGNNGEDLIESVLLLGSTTAAGSKLGGVAILCEAQSTCEKTEDVELFPQNLPWHTILYLMESGSFLDLFFGAVGSEPAYEVSCLVLGIGVQKLCEGNTSAIMTNSTDVIGTFSPADQIAEHLEAKCDGTAELGILEGEGLTTLVNGKALSVSSV